MILQKESVIISEYVIILIIITILCVFFTIVFYKSDILKTIQGALTNILSKTIEHATHEALIRVDETIDDIARKMYDIPEAQEITDEIRKNVWEFFYNVGDRLKNKKGGNELLIKVNEEIEAIYNQLRICLVVLIVIFILISAVYRKNLPLKSLLFYPLLASLLFIQDNKYISTAIYISLVLVLFIWRSKLITYPFLFILLIFGVEIVYILRIVSNSDNVDENMVIIPIIERLKYNVSK